MYAPSAHARQPDACSGSFKPSLELLATLISVSVLLPLSSQFETSIYLIQRDQNVPLLNEKICLMAF